MRVRELFVAFDGNRTRALLTLLGIMIGTGSIVALAGLLRGAEESLLRLNQGVSGADTLRITREEVPAHGKKRAIRELSARDAAALDDAPQLAGTDVTIESRHEARATHGGKEKPVRVMGAGLESRAMYRLQVERGRFIDDWDLNGGRRVVVIGHEVYTQLLGGVSEPLGVQLHIDDETWTVIGILAHKPVTGHGTGTWMWDRRVLVPRTAFDATYTPAHAIDSIFLRVREGEVSTVAGLADAILWRRHGGVQSYKVEDKQESQQEKSILAIIQILLLGTGLMSLFVGGINIMNIMLVTVTERTREIGVRRAVGASPQKILRQFVMEAAAISLLGGVLGVLGGLAFAYLVSLGLGKAFGAWNFYAVPWSMALGLALAVTTGVVFGWIPARRAARLDPVEALRAG